MKAPTTSIGGSSPTRCCHARGRATGSAAARRRRRRSRAASRPTGRCCATTMTSTMPRRHDADHRHLERQVEEIAGAEEDAAGGEVEQPPRWRPARSSIAEQPRVDADQLRRPGQGRCGRTTPRQFDARHGNVVVANRYAAGRRTAPGRAGRRLTGAALLAGRRRVLGDAVADLFLGGPAGVDDQVEIVAS